MHSVWYHMKGLVYHGRLSDWSHIMVPDWQVVIVRTKPRGHIRWYQAVTQHGSWLRGHAILYLTEGSYYIIQNWGGHTIWYLPEGSHYMVPDRGVTLYGACLMGHTILYETEGSHYMVWDWGVTLYGMRLRGHTIWYLTEGSKYMVLY